MIVILLCAHIICSAQSKPKLELFTKYLGPTMTPAKAQIPVRTCGVIINQADAVISKGLKTVALDDLRTASLNLRTCATLNLSRIDRDLAIGIYGEMTAEIERRAPLPN
jgi:hypothetical protein